MLAVWGYIEADFRRDYGIRLVDELPRMSWREFTVLLSGLSPHGAVAAHYDEALKSQREEEERAKGKPGAAVQAFWSGIASFGQG